MPINFGSGNYIQGSSGEIQMKPTGQSGSAFSVLADGRLRQQYKPAGVATHSSNGGLTYSGNYTPLDISGFNNGTHYTLTNTTSNASRFTAPVRGVYHFEWASITTPGGSQFYFTKNGSQCAIGTGAPYAAYGYATGSWATASCGVTLLLNAADWVAVVCGSSASGGWHGGHYSGLTFWMVG